MGNSGWAAGEAYHTLAMWRSGSWSITMLHLRPLHLVLGLLIGAVLHPFVLHGRCAESDKQYDDAEKSGLVMGLTGWLCLQVGEHLRSPQVG